MLNLTLPHFFLSLFLFYKVSSIANSAEWIFLATSLCMEILSAACDQASSPSKPRYALFGMLLAFAALLTCIWELIYKGMKKNVVWGKRGCHMLFGSDIELFALVGGIAQCVCSIIQYICYIRRADNPIKMSLLPAIFLICLIATRLSRKRMQTTYETGEHTALDKD
ncbi:disease resistance RPP13-like protein 1 [Pyrus ussuriensis x Pyrus communis]|uniref:Disease resistance RPP13-like protein 1 n=1 Tax=Pyrus ussuriensis x Pyrus communis TaxID=2448454 RepID=A0A5N5F9S7_9ROSA|nr:disease resistance RPP13-like protein 1 [Pyrus ussuriensis x Pyrus communis]